MRRLISTPNHLPTDRGWLDAFEGDGPEPHEAFEPLDILVMHAGVLRRPWVHVDLDPATGVVRDVDAVFFR